jgi:hypothetical protein
MSFYLRGGLVGGFSGGGEISPLMAFTIATAIKKAPKFAIGRPY